MISPLPPLVLEDGLWQGEDVFPGWADLDPRLSHDAPGPSRGRARLFVAAPGMEEEARRPTPEQVAAYADLKARDATLVPLILDAILRYAEARPKVKATPDLTLDALKGMIGLDTVHIQPVAKGGVAYVGFELECRWDEEHGCGVLTHKGRIVAVDPADTAFEEEAAERDGGTELD